MTNEQWELLVNTVRGVKPKNPVTGFIIDSPWIPGWAGVSTLHFYSSEEIWFQANKKAIETFPEIIFLPVNVINFWAKSPSLSILKGGPVHKSVLRGCLK